MEGFESHLEKQDKTDHRNQTTILYVEDSSKIAHSSQLTQHIQGVRLER